MPDMRVLEPDDWPTLRDIRLAALRESPLAFLSTHDQEKAFGPERWLSEFTRGNWHVGTIDGRPVSLVGITREPETKAHECYLEYVWVAPEVRRRGVAFRMLTDLLDHLRASGISTVFLWVLDGNGGATRLYKRIGFVSSNLRQPLEARPGRSEELMHVTLA
jgi:ribosomal protein S18 acetylase RimI-like enzyme